MPTYNPFDFSIRLHIWDPENVPDQLDEKLMTLDPTTGQEIEEVSEQYFVDHQGLEFLEQSRAPFYLVNAGRELFFGKPPSIDGGKDVRLIVIQEDSKTGVEQTAPLITPTNRQAVTQPLSARSNGAGRGWSYRPPNPNTTQNLLSKPLDTPIPIKIQYKFDRKSFPHSLYNDKEFFDLCVGIFYNGEFVSAKTYQSNSARSSTAAGKQLNLSGRRVKVKYEVPFMVVPLSEGLDNHNDHHNSINLEDRWNRINDLMLDEAGKWGTADDSDTRRSPIGECLEDLSKLRMPREVSKRRDGRNIGIIDIVVALGRTAVNWPAVQIPEPERKLPEWISSKTKKPLNPAPREPRSALRERLLRSLRLADASPETVNDLTQKRAREPSPDTSDHNVEHRPVTKNVRFDKSTSKSRDIGKPTSSTRNGTLTTDIEPQKKGHSMSQRPKSASGSSRDSTSSRDPASSRAAPSSRAGGLPTASGLSNNSGSSKLPWTPTDLCKDSVLSYVSKEQVNDWFNLELEEGNDCPTRHVAGEKEGVFRAQSIMVAVRYVFGANVEDSGKGKWKEKETADISEEANKRSQFVGETLEEDVEMSG